MLKQVRNGVLDEENNGMCAGDCTQRPDGGFYVPKPGRGGSGLGNYNTSVCVSALYESGIAPTRAILDARTYIAGSQLTGDDTMSGGFGYDRASRRRYADLSNTSYALDAMRRTEGVEEFRPQGVMHCFSGSAEFAKEILKLGLYIGLGGAATFKNARKPLEVAAMCPADRLLLETDCPYMAPVPFRGKRNDSSLIVHIAERLAEVRGEDAQALTDQCRKNAERLFRLNDKN